MSIQTTLKIDKIVLKDLRTLEIHPRETNQDIIKRLIKIGKEAKK